MGIITSQSRFTETYPIPAIAEIISSLKFLDSFEAAALSFEVFRPRRVSAFPFAFVRVLPVVSFHLPHFCQNATSSNERMVTPQCNYQITGFVWR